MGSASRTRYVLKTRSPARKKAIEALNSSRRHHERDEKKENILPAPKQAITAMSTVSLAACQEKLRQAEHARDQYACQVVKHERENTHLRRLVAKYKSQHHNDRRKLARAQKGLELMRKRIGEFSRVQKTVKKMMKNQQEAARKEELTRRDAEVVLAWVGNVNTELRTDLRLCHRRIRTLERLCARFPKRLADRVEQAKTRPLTFHLRKKGIYTSQARALASMLIRSGCSQSKVGRLVQKVGAAFGISVPDRMSWHTVQRAVLERKIAYDIQLGYELKQSPSFTVSGDAPTDRHVNMEARFMIVHTPKRYGDTHDPSPALVPKNRFLAVDSSVDHTSETQLHGWQGKLHNLTVAYSASPFARRNRNVLDVLECVVKLKGAGGDHAADQLKTVQLLIAWKREMTCLLLARTFLGSGATPSPQMSQLILRSTAASVDTVGGGGCWAIMTSEARMTVYTDHFNRAVEDVGKELYEALPSEERRPLDLFLRLGCAMHKDLNSVKGGAAAMSTTWEEQELTPPILLANKDNVLTLRDVDPDALATASLACPEGLSPAELRALEASTRGAVKLVSLAGAIFNNKDDKKGQHDTYVYYFQHFLKWHGVRFPDTSNTRYQSYCAAAAELLVNREYYLSFLEFVRDRKQSPGLTNIEQNVYNGLQDPATLTELAVLTLYAEAVTHPYMRVARVHQNGLKLGPLHEKLKAHVQRLIRNPDLLLAADATYETGSLDGREWERTEVFIAIQQAAPRLPHLREILVGFLKGALRTWDKFNVEFAAGGAIDQASEAELDAAYILPTNDHNEGALGAYCVWRRHNPNGTLAYFNALKAFESDDTEEFMATYLCHEEDEKHLRAAAQALGSSGHEAKHRQELIEHALAASKEKAREREEKERRENEEKARLRRIPLVFKVHELAKLKKVDLQDQLDVYKKVYGDGTVPPKSRMGNKPEKLAALLEAIERNEPGKLDRSTD